MDEAAKKIAENVTQSNVSAIVMAAIFLVFFGVAIYLLFRRQDKQDEAMAKRDEVMMDRFATIQSENREQQAKVALQFAKVTKEQHDALERRDEQNIVLLKDTIETMGGLAESVRGLSLSIARLEAEVAKKADRP